MKSMNNDEKAASWNRGKVFSGQHLGSTGRHKPADLGPLKPLEIHEILSNPEKSMKINEIAGSWDRVKVSLAARLIGPSNHRVIESSNARSSAAKAVAWK